uniref:Uncharacterized protein n=1 Tax=Anguilla anguilla TaxID=7936 RepID=A0A0E9V7T2_ANGAN
MHSLDIGLYNIGHVPPRRLAGWHICHPNIAQLALVSANIFSCSPLCKRFCWSMGSLSQCFSVLLNV